MSYEALVGSDIGTLKATADLSTKQYRFLKPDLATDGQANVAAAASDLLIGVLQNTPALGEAIQLRTIGISKILLGGTVTRGDRLTSDAVGRAITAVGAVVVGAIAVQSGLVGDIISAFVCQGEDDFLALTVAATAAGFKIARGQGTNVAASDTVVTGLATVVSAVANMEDAPVIGCDRIFANIGDQVAAPVAGSILIKSYKPTAAGDATPIAATTFVKKYNWIAIGT